MIHGGIVMIIDKGQLIRDKHGEQVLENYTAKLVSFEALYEIVDLMQRVYNSLPNKDVLFVDSYEELFEDLQKGAKIIGIYGERNQLICFRYVSFPGYENRNHGYDLGTIIPHSEFDKVCQLETTIVDIPYRGNNLQSITLGLMIPIIKELGYKHLVCTISPYNYHSVKNIMKHGLKIKSLKKKYARKEDGSDGIWRYILHGKIGEELGTDDYDLVNIDMTDIETQLELINKGYIGFEIDAEKEYIKFIKYNK